MRSIGAAIECVSAGRQVLVPAEAIEQIVEDDARPLPLSDPRVGGIAVVGTDLVVSLRLGDRRESVRRDPSSRRASRDEPTSPDDGKEGKTTGALLVSTEGHRSGDGVRYAVEITRVVSLVAVETRRLAGGATDHAWFGEGITTDGRTLPILDVAAMLAELGVVIGGVRREGGAP